MTGNHARKRKPSSDINAITSPYFLEPLSNYAEHESKHSKDVELKRRLHKRPTKPIKEYSLSESSEEFYENKVARRRKGRNTRKKRNTAAKVSERRSKQKPKSVVLRDRQNYCYKSENTQSDESSGDLFVEIHSSPSRRQNNKEITKPSPSYVPIKNKISDRTESLKPHVSDSDDSAGWEEVVDKNVEELEFMEELLKESAVSEHDGVNSFKKEMTISVPLFDSKRSKTVCDPQRAAELDKIKTIKNLYSSMHYVHLMCFLAHTRFMNRLCDSSIYRGLGLSLLSGIPTLLIKSNELLPYPKWTSDHLKACVATFHSYVGGDRQGESKRSCQTILSRLREGQLTVNDCTLLLVASLRALSFDVRLVLALRPMPLKPTSNQLKHLNSSGQSSESGTMKLSKKEMINRKIISSSDEDAMAETNVLDHSPKVVVLAEVFLPFKGSWLTVNTNSMLVSDEADEIILPGFLYVLGLTACVAKDVSVAPYVGRNPVDLSSRYDPDWCVDSRRYRILSDKWNNLMKIQRLFFNSDAFSSLSVVSQPSDLPTTKRDRDDEDKIRNILLKKPFPSRLQDYKNHPLYALKRNLLKFEVLYPPDATPVGFFRQEPIYLKECVHLCHTRESWLKEAKVVRPHETPAKVVKARLTLKRKLLQGSGEPPPTVNVYGVWQVDDYVPPVAQNGIVPRNEHGNVELFKPCMLPIGCVHICLSGIHHIAKELKFDCAQAMVGWEFHGSGWAHPRMHGYVVCREDAPALIDAWHEKRMDAAKAAAADRSERALENWRRLVRGLFLWHWIKAQYALNPLYLSAATPLAERRCPDSKQKTSAHSSGTRAPAKSCRGSSNQDHGPLLVPTISTAGGSTPGGLSELTGLPTFPHQKPNSRAKTAKRRHSVSARPLSERSGPGTTKRKTVRRRCRKDSETTSEEEEEESLDEEFNSTGED